MRSGDRRLLSTWSVCNVPGGGEEVVRGDVGDTRVEWMLVKVPTGLPEFTVGDLLVLVGRVACVKSGAFRQWPLLRGRQFKQGVLFLTHRQHLRVACGGPASPMSANEVQSCSNCKL